MLKVVVFEHAWKPTDLCTTCSGGNEVSVNNLYGAGEHFICISVCRPPVATAVRTGVEQILQINILRLVNTE